MAPENLLVRPYGLVATSLLCWAPDLPVAVDIIGLGGFPWIEEARDRRPAETGQERGPHAPDKDVTGARSRARPGARHLSQRGHRTHRTAAHGAHRAWVRS
jgi:hypothetical protein